MCYNETKNLDVIKWKHFPCYWPFVKRIHRSSVNSPHKGQWREALKFSLICVRTNGWVNTRWFETPLPSLWRHCSDFHAWTPLDNMTAHLQRTNFSGISWMKVVQFWYFFEFCSLGCDWWEVIIGSDNDLAPNRRQAIIYDPVHWRIYAPLGEMSKPSIKWKPVLTHWGRDKMDAISQTTFSSAFCWMKIFEFQIKFHWSFFLRVQLTIFYHWFR